jgi:hypothetical protein
MCLESNYQRKKQRGFKAAQGGTRRVLGLVCDRYLSPFIEIL